MSVKNKIKRLNKEISKLEQQKSELLQILGNEQIKKSSKEQLYENIIKFAITNHIGNLRGGIMVDYNSIDKMRDLRLFVESNHYEHAYMIKVSY